MPEFKQHKQYTQFLYNFELLLYCVSLNFKEKIEKIDLFLQKNYKLVYVNLDFKQTSDLEKFLNIIKKEIEYNDVLKTVFVALSTIKDETIQQIIYFNFEFFKLILLYLCLKSKRDIAVYTVVIKNKEYIYKVKELALHLNTKLINIHGFITRASTEFYYCKLAYFYCSNCEENYEYLQKYNETVNPKCTKKTCIFKNKGLLILDKLKSVYVKTQLIEINELQQNIDQNEFYESIKCIAQNNFVNKFVPGQEIILTGVLSIDMVKNNIYNYNLDVLNIIEKEIINENQFTISELLSFESFSKQENYWQILKDVFFSNIYGHDIIKDGLILQLFEGQTKKIQNGVNLRGSIHILLIGDPGTAKSQFLKIINSVSQGLLVTATSTTAKGLTAVAIKDERTGKWHIEAGAMVLANKNILCIDELDKIKAIDLHALNEAMEQQTISIAKAGLVQTLKAKTSVLAAANPIFGRFNDQDELARQLNLPAALLSRFDLIFILQDIIDEEQDKMMSKHILKTHKYATDYNFENETKINLSFLKKYIIYAKTLEPKLSSAAITAIQKYYLKLRIESKKNKINITTRQLDAIVRLSEAKSKSRLSFIVELQDVTFALNIFSNSLYSDINFKNEIETGYTQKQMDIVNLILKMFNTSINSKKLNTQEIINYITSNSKYTVNEINLAIEKLRDQNKLISSGNDNLELV